MDLPLKKALSICLVVYGAPAMSAPESVFGVFAGQGRLYSSDINGETQNSESAGVRGIYFEQGFSDSISIYTNLKKTETLCFSRCYDLNASIGSIELSAKYSQELMPWLSGFGRLGANFYNVDRMLGSWHLAHNNKSDSGAAAAAALGFDFNPQGKVRVGLEYSFLSIQKSENLRTLSISFGMTL